jgi:hypothetical protein
MKVLAIYAINLHLDELIEESRQYRLAKEARGDRPSMIRRAITAARTALARPASDSPALAA